MKKLSVLLMFTALMLGGCGKPDAVPYGHLTVGLVNDAIDYHSDIIERRLKVKGLKAYAIDKEMDGIYSVKARDRNHELYEVWFTRNNHLDMVFCGHGVRLYDKAHSIVKSHKEI